MAEIDIADIVPPPRSRALLRGGARRTGRYDQSVRRDPADDGAEDSSTASTSSAAANAHWRHQLSPITEDHSGLHPRSAARTSMRWRSWNISVRYLNAIEIALGIQRLIDECSLRRTPSPEGGQEAATRRWPTAKLAQSALPTRCSSRSRRTTHLDKATPKRSPEPRRAAAAAETASEEGLYSVRQAEGLACAGEQRSDEAPAAARTRYPENYLRLVEQLRTREDNFSREIAVSSSKNGAARSRIKLRRRRDAIERFIRTLRRAL